MPALTTIELLEQAVGRELSAEEQSEANYFIDLVSEHIISYTGKSFSVVEQTVRFKADYYGTINLPGGPVQSVESVKLWGSDSEDRNWLWDGLAQIYHLRPMQVVDVTFTSGYPEVPDDISMIATEATKRLFESPSGNGVGPMTRYRVGDVEEAYRAVDVGSLGGLFNDLEKLILDDYRQTEGSWYLGFSQDTNPPPPFPQSHV